MSGGNDLELLLRNMQPTLAEQTYVFWSMSESDLARLDAVPIMVFREAEGVTVVLTAEDAQARQLPVSERWALNVTVKTFSVERPPRH